MGKSYLPDGQGAVFKNIIRFAGNTPLDGRAVVDTFNDISGEKYKALFTHEGVASYYVGMLVVTKDTGKVYVLKETGFEEVTPDLSTILGSKSVNTYEDAVKLATNDNIGQIIYVKTKTSYDADGEGEGEAITYDAAPYIVVGKDNLQKLAASTASGDIEGDVRDLIGRVVELEKVDHSHANAGVLDGITSDKVTAWDNAANEAHSHANEGVLDGITSDKVTAWDNAASKAHSHANADVLDGITSDKVTAWDKAQENVIEKIIVDDKVLTINDSDKSVSITLPNVPVKGITTKESGQILTLNGEKLDTSLELKYIPASGETPAYLRLLGVANEQGVKTVVSQIDATDFVKDGMITSVELADPTEDETGTKYLVITWNTDAEKGENTVTRIDITELFNPYSAGNGIDISGSTFSVVTKDNYIGVDGEGLYVTNDLWDEVKNLDNQVLAAAKKYYDENEKTHTHTNKSVLDGITSDKVTAWDNASKDSHVHANADVLNGITSDKVTAWDKAQENVIEEVKLFGTALDITNKSVDVDFDATDVKVGEDIKDGETVVYSADTKVSAVLKGIQNSISNAIKGAFDKVEAGDGIAVTDVQNNKQTISVKLSTDTDNLLKLKEDGLFVAMYYDGDDVEE